MYCPRCGKPTETGEKICSNCGLDFEAIPPANDTDFDSQLINIQQLSRRLHKVNIRLICFSIIALSILIFSFIAAGKVSGSANEILQIRSNGGNTVNEVYYREMGNIYNGYAMFMRECGVFFACVLVGLGLKRK